MKEINLFLKNYGLEWTLFSTGVVADENDEKKYLIKQADKIEVYSEQEKMDEMLYFLLRESGNLTVVNREKFLSKLKICEENVEIPQEVMNPIVFEYEIDGNWCRYFYSAIYYEIDVRDAAMEIICPGWELKKIFEGEDFYQKTMEQLEEKADKLCWELQKSGFENVLQKEFYPLIKKEAKR